MRKEIEPQPNDERPIDAKEEPLIVADALRDEIDRRIDEWEASPKIGASWEEVRARLQRDR